MSKFPLLSKVPLLYNNTFCSSVVLEVPSVEDAVIVEVLVVEDPVVVEVPVVEDPVVVEVPVVEDPSRVCRVQSS